MSIPRKSFVEIGLFFTTVFPSDLLVQQDLYSVVGVSERMWGLSSVHTGVLGVAFRTFLTLALLCSSLTGRIRGRRKAGLGFSFLGTGG